MLEITVKTLDSQNHSFSCEDDITVHGFKEHIAETVSVPAESQRLIYRGRVLQDDKKLNDYGNVNGQVIHLVQRAPPQPESHSSNSDAQRQNNDQNSPRDGSRVQYLRHLHRNAMYLGAMSMPAEVVEGLPAPHLSNTLSNSRLIAARRMLNKAIQLMDRLDDPSVPLHPSPTESNAPEPPPQASAPEEEAEQDSTVNSNENNSGNRMVQAFSEMAAAFSAAALINIRLSHGNNEDGGSVSGSVNVIDASQLGESGQAQAREPEQETSSSQRLAQTASDVESERPNAERAEAERTETERNDASTSSNSESQNASQRSTPQVPRPPRMAELLDRLIITQSRLRTYIERYRSLMLADPILTPDDGPEGVAENQRIVNGVSECLHYLAHACHALSDIIVDMGQQPPRNLRCRPIIIQHSAILQAGIPIQVESHINLTRRNATNNNNNNATDEGNEATRPSSPTSASSDQNSRSNNASNRSIPQSANGQQNQPSILGTLFNLPSNVELSMELSPQSAMDISSPSAPDGAENDQSQSNNNNNNNGNAGGTNSVFSMSPTFALIRDALQSVLAVSERRSQIDTSNGTVINTPTNIPFVTIVGQQAMDLGSSNSGQSTQARSNIGTHPTTSTQTRSTARPHVLHPHTHPLNVGVGMGQSLDFDPFLPCNSHHIRRNPPATANATSTSQSNQANQSTTSESHTRSQSASHTSSTSTGNVPQSHSVNFTVGGDANVTRDLVENDGQALASGIGLVMSLNELLQSPGTSNIHFSVVDSGLNHGEIHLTPNSDIPLADLFTSLNVRLDEFADRNFLMNLGIFMLRNITIGGMVQLDQGQSGPLVNLRRPLREFLEHSFPNASQATLQERILEQIVSFNRPYLQAFIVPEEATNRRIDILATFESLIHKFCEEFLKLLFNNDLDNATFAQEAVTLAKKLENQFSAVLQYIFQGEQSTFEAAMTRFINHLTEDIPPFLQQTVQGDLSSRIRSYVTRTSSLSQEEIASLIIYKDEPSAPPAESESAQVPEEKKEPQVNSESRKQEQAQAQAQSQQPEQEPKQPAKKEKLDEATNDVKSEPMELELDSKAVNDPMDLANGEEIPETFPGAENIPAEWVPIIARDSVRQREQAQLEALQGGPIPFSDAYLSTMPSKRRKLIEQQKPQLLANPTPNGTAITASVERLVREGISHSQLQEAEGAAGAVAAVPAVRRAFGQAIKDSLHPGRLKTPDFPNTARFPNASKYFADAENKDEKEAAKPNTATTK